MNKNWNQNWKNILENEISSGNFQLSPDFRQRASSNASSVGRLSPIPSLAIEADWAYATELPAILTEGQNGSTNGTEPTQQQVQQLDQLAGSLADDLTLQTDYLQGSVSDNPSRIHFK